MPPDNQRPEQRSARFLAWAFRAFLFAALAMSVATYFTALSQYPTADQPLTFVRLSAFLADPRSVELAQGSLVSQLILAVPGHAIAAVLDSFFHINDQIVFNIRYTPFLPYAAMQVIWSLLLIAFLSFLVVEIVGPAKHQIGLVLFVFILLMNVPIIKALSKILKYDTLSTLCSAVAIVLYIGYRRYGGRPPLLFFGRLCVPVIATFCALAFLEKDASISSTLIIVCLECAIIPFAEDRTSAAILSAGKFLLTFSVIFVVESVILVPKVLLDLHQLPRLYDAVPFYFANAPAALYLAAVTAMACVYTAGPRLRQRWPHFFAAQTVSKVGLAIGGISVASFALAALIFQENVIFDPTIVRNDLDVTKLREQGVYISKPIADSAITTLDHSALVQHAKVFFSMVRAIFYTSPEISVLLIAISAPTALVLARWRQKKLESDSIALLLLLVFPTAMMAAYALVDLPFGPQYLDLVTLLMTIYGVVPALMAFRHLGNAAACGVQFVIIVLTIWLTLPADPSYLRNKNLFRDRASENAAALDMNHYIWWTWAGWGETAYSIGRYIEQEKRTPVVVAFDYLAPFYSAPNIKWTPAGLNPCVSELALRAALLELQRQAIDYLIISKNRSNRNWCENQILQRFSGQAEYVDIQQGVNYGWLFRFSDIGAVFLK